MALQRQEYLKQISFSTSKDDLTDLYINKKMSGCAIAEMLNCGESTVRKYLIKYNIPVRSLSEAHVGQKHTDETKSKIALAHTGKKRAPFSQEWLDNLSRAHKGRVSSMLGKHHSEETKQKMSVAGKGRKKPPGHGKHVSEATAGQKHWNWKGGITHRGKEIINSLEYNKWRKEVYQRDNFTCVKCGEVRSGNFEAHHLESFMAVRDLRTEVSNGITFCRPCHKSFHRIYGRGNTTKEQTENFLLPELEYAASGT